MSHHNSQKIGKLLFKSASILSVGICCHTACGVDFDAYKPDKSGKTDVSDILQEAVSNAAMTDKVLLLSPGRYWLAKPVVIQFNNMIISSKITVSPAAVYLQGYQTGPSRETLITPEAPAKTEAILVAQKTHHLTIVGITFEHSVVGIKGDHAIALSKIINCAFFNCDYGIKAEPLQVVTISGSSFDHGKFGILARDGGQFVKPRPGTKGPRRNRSNLVYIHDCTFRRLSEYAVEIEGSPTNVRDCLFENSDGGAIRLFDIYVSNIVGCYFEGSAMKGNPLISVSPFQLPEGHNGQLNVYGNQINACGGEAIIHVGKGSQLHVYDNRVAVSSSKGQVLVKAEESGEHIKSENNITRDSSIP